MTNEERRAALNLARRKTLEYAEAADIVSAQQEAYQGLAIMWADVANAMKDGDPLHDAPDGLPAGITTRDASRSKFTTPAAATRAVETYQG